MNPSHAAKISLLFAVLVAASPTLEAASSSELLQKGLYAEEVEGNLDSAIKIYGEVAASKVATRPQVAQALYRQGMCYVKIKDEAAARPPLQKLVTDYSDQTELVEKARSVLEDLTNFDPATLMPPGTLVYVELGSPGRQVETILNMLKGTPFENPLAVVGGRASTNVNQRSPADVVSALLNPSMLAEFKKIRSSAVGITGFSRQGPPSTVAVMYPGKSDALRGVLLAVLGMGGTPGETIEGMQTTTIQNAVGVAYDDKVVIATQPPQQLAWCVKQYKGTISEPSLATKNQSFAALGKKQRQEQALTLWAKADETYAKALEMFPPGKAPQGLLAANAIVDFRNMDSLTLSLAIEPDGLAYKAGVLFKDGHQSLAYDLIRTPNIGKAAFEAVPAQAVALASFALSAADGAQTEKLRAGIQNVTGLDIGREIFANIKQVTLFVMPANGAPAKGPVFYPGQLGLALTSHDPGQTRQLLSKLLGTAELISSGGTNQSGKYKVGRTGETDLYCYLEQVNGITVLSLNREIVDAALAAVKDRKSARSSGPLSKAINKLAPTASKLLLANVGGVIRLSSRDMNPSLLSPEKAKQFADAVDQLARASESTTVELRTDEQLNDFAAVASVNGVPPLNEVIGPARQIAAITSEVKARATAGWQQQETPALFMPAAAAPVIDGNVDEVWNGSRSYTLANLLKGDKSATNHASANYRAMWDKDNLYVLVDVTDTMLRHDPAIPWQLSDGVEIYIDGDNAKPPGYGEFDVQYAFNWDQTAPTLKEMKHSRMDGVRFAQAITDKGYRLEMAIPWSTLNAKPAPGAKLGFDVQVNDNRGGNDRAAKISWNDRDDRAWQSPQVFGTATLGGLVGWWKLDESQGTTAADSSGGNHNGTVVGNASWKPGKHGGALDLNGGSYVRIADKSAFDMADQVTIACWVKLRSVPAQWTAIVTKGDTAWRLSTAEQEKRLHFAIENWDAANARVNSAKEVNANEWHHVAAVYTGDVMRLYVDGKLDASQAIKGRIGRNNFEVMIGENAEKKGRAFDGLIDDVRIYNYALPESQVMALAAGE